MAAVKKRQSNIELLRIVTMMMIIMLHLLDKGEVLPWFGDMHSFNDYFSWYVEALCIISVNVYVFISGYFLLDSKFTFKKLFFIVAQVWFYSVGIFLLCYFTGGIPAEDINIYSLIMMFLPVLGNHYWFATTYVLLMLVFPFLNTFIKAMDEKRHRRLIIILVIIFSLWVTVLPVTNPVVDKWGMDLPWFVVLYFIASYMKKYPDRLKGKAWGYLLAYALVSTTPLIFARVLIGINNRFGKLGGYSRLWYQYNVIPVVIMSIAFFVFFLKIDIKNKVIGNIINFVARATFGVYLIHEHLYVRFRWTSLFDPKKYFDKPYWILRAIGIVIIMFVVCASIDIVRIYLFKLLFDNPLCNKLWSKFGKIEDKINGQD
ncbi:MAG: acyltransferase [Lachnospiraceae bacterium]|nr:acyltransferase [Lachnospiraceae bacterium]